MCSELRYRCLSFSVARCRLLLALRIEKKEELALYWIWCVQCLWNNLYMKERKLLAVNLRSQSLLHILFPPLERRQFRFTIALFNQRYMAHHVLFQICASQKSGNLILQTLWFWLFKAADSFGVVFYALNKTKERCHASKFQCYAHQSCGCSVVCLCINKDNTRHLQQIYQMCREKERENLFS